MRRLIRKAWFYVHDLKGHSFTRDHPRYKKYEIGEWTYGLPIVYDWNDGTRLVIGKFCSIARGVKIYLGGEHRMDWVSTWPFSEFFEEAKGVKGHPASKGDVIIENDVWIGGDAAILSGVTLGNGCVVGAGSVVTKSVPPYAVAAGNPARVVKYRFDQKTVEKLLKMQWWDWPVEKIKEALPEIMSEDVEKFVGKA